MPSIESSHRGLASGAESHFAGQIGEEYNMLRLICPAAGDISRRVGEFLKVWSSGSVPPGVPLRVVEIGCGTGITTSELLSARDDQLLTAVDIEPTMLSQARRNLADWISSGRVSLVEGDALSFLRRVETASVDVVASAYAFHNFLEHYRRQVVVQVYRVLKPGGVFVNGDRYALDDASEQTRLIQEEVKHYFATFSTMQRYDLLEQWVVHLFSDESPDHVMRLEPALQSYREAGFVAVAVHDRYQNNALVTAEKPGP